MTLFLLVIRALEFDPPIRRPVLLKRNPKLQQLHNDIAELLKEDLTIPRISLNMLLEALVPDERHIRRQHHQRLSLVLILLRPIPILPPPLLVHQQPEILVRDRRRAKAPRTLEAAAVLVAAADGVCAAQSHDLAVVEAHAVEDGAQVILLLGAVGEASVGGAEGDVAVLSAGAPGDGRALHLLDGADAGEGPEVGVGDPGELFWKGTSFVSWRVKGWDGLTLHWLEEVSGVLQTSIGTVITFWSKPHSRTVAATGSCSCIVGTAAVPRESDQDWTIAAIVVLITLDQEVGDLVVDLLVVLFRWLENTWRLPCAAFGQVHVLDADVSLFEVEVATSSCSNKYTGADIQRCARFR